MKKSTNIIRIVLQVLVSFSFVAGAYSKLVHNPMEVAMFSAVNISSTLMIVGVLELLVAILIWFKKTRVFAILLATAILGAAVAESISFSGIMSAVAPAVTIVLTWIVLWLDCCHCHCNCDGCKDCTAGKEMTTPTV